MKYVSNMFAKTKAESGGEFVHYIVVLVGEIFGSSVLSKTNMSL